MPGPVASTARRALAKTRIVGSSYPFAITGRLRREHTMKSSLTRGRALRQIAGLPLAAFAVGATLSAAQAADNKKQFKYQDKPGKGGAKCSGCRFFRAPHGC